MQIVPIKLKRHIKCVIRVVTHKWYLVQNASLSWKLVSETCFSGNQNLYSSNKRSGLSFRCPGRTLSGKTCSVLYFFNWNTYRHPGGQDGGRIKNSFSANTSRKMRMGHSAWEREEVWKLMHIWKTVMGRRKIYFVITPDRRVGIAGEKLQRGRFQFNTI